MLRTYLSLSIYSLDKHYIKCYDIGNIHYKKMNRYDITHIRYDNVRGPIEGLSPRRGERA
jgi:hypothetical protein